MLPRGSTEELVLRLFRSSGESDRVNLESTIQNTIHAAGHPVPRVPIDSGGHSLIGRPFLIMERLEGSTLASGLEDQSLFEKLPGLMGNLQVGIHETDSADLRTQLADAEVDIRHMTPKSMLERVSKLAEASGVAELTAIRQWLTERWPTQPVDPVICHGDFHPANILVADGKVTGLIDWGNVMFTHPEYDVAIPHMIMSIGPIDLDGKKPPREDLRKAVEWAMAEYLAAYRTQRPLDDDLLEYYGALRAAHAYARVISANRGVDLPYTAHDAYAWRHPVLFAVIRNILEKTTGVAIEPL